MNWRPNALSHRIVMDRGEPLRGERVGSFRCEAADVLVEAFRDGYTRRVRVTLGPIAIVIEAAPLIGNVPGKRPRLTNAGRIGTNQPYSDGTRRTA